MLELRIPGFGWLRIRHVVLDYNGTIAVDGNLLGGVKPRIAALAKKVRVHVLTADTFGGVRAALRGVNCEVVVLGPTGQARAKAGYVRTLGAARTACIGNGRNDRLMLRSAALGIAVLQDEGIAAETLRAADVVTRDARDALDLLLDPLRLVATLRD
jgi:soluble P-type ATPase